MYLMKYNLLTKRKNVLLQACDIYLKYVSGEDIVASYKDNIKNLYLFWKKNIGIRHLNLIKFMDYSIQVFVAKNEIYTALLKLDDYEMCVYNFEGFVKQHDLPPEYFTISDNGKNIIFRITDCMILYVINFNGNFGKDGTFITRNREIDFFDFTNCDYLISISIDNREEIYNINNNTSLVLDPEYFCECVTDRYFLACHKNRIKIYNSNSFDFLAAIDRCTIFRAFNYQLNVLIGEDLECYRITEDYHIYKVKVGENYVTDIDYLPLQIMIVMDIIVQVINLPYEILCIELYQTILKLLIHFDP